MPIHAAPPMRVAHPGYFDYVAVDAARHRAYAAHTGALRLLVLDTGNGKVLGQLKIGPLHGVAIDEANGDVFTGDGTDDAVSEIDPAAMKEVRRVPVAGPVDAIQYDPQLHRIYADEDDGDRVFVIDSATFKEIGKVKLPGKGPEYLQIDPRTHDVYQNVAQASEIAVIDPQTLSVTRTIATPEILNDHPLQLDPALGELLVGGENHRLSVYKTDGTRVASFAYPSRVDQCDLDQRTQIAACSGGGKLVLVAMGAKPGILAQTDVNEGIHTGAIDPSTGKMWFVWGSKKTGAFVQEFTYTP